MPAAVRAGQKSRSQSLHDLSRASHDQADAFNRNWESPARQRQINTEQVPPFHGTLRSQFVIT